MTLQLRDYQQSGVDAIRAAFRQHDAVLYQLPTGGGKGLILSYIAKSSASLGNEVVIVAHRREILDQISGSLDDMGVRHGFIAPGMPYTNDRVQIGMVQTCTRRVARLRKPRFLICDESHRILAAGYRSLLSAWPGMKILGVTATPARLDGKPLGDVFQTLITGPDIRTLVAAGHLEDFDYYAPPAVADISGVKTKMGDYDVVGLSAAMDKATVTGDAVAHYREVLAGAPAIAFCVSIDHARHVAAQFLSQGFRAASIDGSMGRSDRRKLLADLAAGRLSILTSAELISEGVDVPACQGAILLRPTKSLTVFLQQVGRALRKKSDGSRAVILDHVGNAAHHGRPDEPRAWTLTGKVPPVSIGSRTCRQCFRVLVPPITCSVDECPLLSPAEGVLREAPEVVDGKLVALTDTLEWAGGIDIVRAAGPEWRALMARAGTDPARLKIIQRARGYHHRWITHIIKSQRARSALAEVRFPTFAPSSASVG